MGEVIRLLCLVLIDLVNTQINLDLTLTVEEDLAER